jgi:hypothetical protein
MSRITEVHPHAALALRAATHTRQWGVAAAGRFCAKRGVPLCLYLLARRLEGGAL